MFFDRAMYVASLVPRQHTESLILNRLAMGNVRARISSVDDIGSKPIP